MSALQSLKQLLYEPKAPPHLVRKFIPIADSQFRDIESVLKTHYFIDLPPDYFSTALGAKDLKNHVIERMAEARQLILPWLDAARRLDGGRILEIGCGTGSSTAALAEQGAIVTGVDVDEKSLVAAGERCRALGLKAQFHLANATEVAEKFADETFDFIIFYASVEHMTHEERLIALKTTWDMLRPGACWVITDTPNRLWFHDYHTSFMPFFMWLPDDLAYRYSRFSGREQFRELYRDPTPESMLHFLRRGRGVSFHEFELTMKPAAELDIVSSLATFQRQRRPLRAIKWRLSRLSQYERFLARAAPGLHRGWFQQRLDLIIRKS
jgi:2-polyprenyl-3-methyl-5-hydroxy-6-metoxy-1,4-benzoquinol methylase